MEQLSLLDAAPVKTAKPVKPLTCACGTPWTWPHVCAACDVATEEGCRRFDEMVAAGVYNARGYTLSDWKQAGHAAATWRLP